MRSVHAALRAARRGSLVASVGGALAVAQPAPDNRVVPSSARRAALVCEVDPPAGPWAGFKADFRGQVTARRRLPVIPTNVAEVAVELQGGPFGSRWLHVRHGVASSEVLQQLAEAEAGAPSAVWVGVPDDYLQSPQLVAELRLRGYRFHHVLNGGDVDGMPANELLYYRWLGKGADMVPSYTTAHEGVGALVLSPDRKDVLLVWEYGNWKMITGNLDGCDSVMATVRREVQEECGLELADDLLMVGGWQDAKAYDRSGNNVFTIFVATSRTRDIHVDGEEISQARWFPLSSLPSAADSAAAAQLPSAPYSIRWDSGDPDKCLFSRVVPRFLAAYVDGRGLRIEHHQQRTIFN